MSAVEKRCKSSFHPFFLLLLFQALECPRKEESVLPKGIWPATAQWNKENQGLLKQCLTDVESNQNQSQIWCLLCISHLWSWVFLYHHLAKLNLVLPQKSVVSNLPHFIINLKIFDDSFKFVVSGVLLLNKELGSCFTYFTCKMTLK